MDKKKNIEISKRRVFDKKLGPLYIILFSILIPMTLSMIFTFGYRAIMLKLLIVIIPLTIALMVLLFNLAFIIQGVEIDIEKRSIRRYRKIFFFKYGNWMDFSNFKMVSITSDHLALGRQSSGGFESHFYYNVTFVNENSKFNIRIDEFKNYYKAHSFALQTSLEFNLEMKDYIKGKNVASI